MCLLVCHTVQYVHTHKVPLAKMAKFLLQIKHEQPRLTMNMSQYCGFKNKLHRNEYLLFIKVIYVKKVSKYQRQVENVLASN